MRRLKGTRLAHRANSKRKMKRGARLAFQKVEVAPCSTSLRVCFSKVVVLLTPTSCRPRFFNRRTARCANSKRITRPYFKRPSNALRQSQPLLSNTSKSYLNQITYTSRGNVSKGWRSRTFCSGGSLEHRAEDATNTPPGAGAQAS